MSMRHYIPSFTLAALLSVVCWSPPLQAEEGNVCSLHHNPSQKVA